LPSLPSQTTKPSI